MTTAPGIDIRLHSDAIKAVVDAQLGDEARAYQYDEVPGSTAYPNDTDGTAALELPDIYVVISVERRPAPNLRSTGQSGRTGWRVTAQCVGRTVREARWAQLQVTRALEEQTLPVGDRRTTRLQHDTTTDPRLDEGRFTGTNEFIYVV